MYAQRKYVTQARKPKLDSHRFEKILDRFAQVRLAVVGDIILDEYLVGDAERVSPEAPVPVVHIQSESVVLGGAGNVVRNLVALGVDCEFASVVGKDLDGDRVVELLQELGVPTSGVIRVEDRPTTRKTRVVAGGQQIVRVDRESHAPVTSAISRRLLQTMQSSFPRVGGVILEDYGKGLFVPASIRKLIAACVAAKVAVSVDPKSELRAYKGATLMKPNLREAEQLAGIRASETGGLDPIAKKLRKAFGDGDLVITRGGNGMTLFEGSDAGRVVATIGQEVFDVQGAGDTTIAILATARAAGATLLEAAIFANAGASVVVEQAGTATASRAQIAARLPQAIEAARKGWQ
jgi:rfaE bifunctional protein kinase chain/domain